MNFLKRHTMGVLMEGEPSGGGGDGAPSGAPSSEPSSNEPSGGTNLFSQNGTVDSDPPTGTPPASSDGSPASSEPSAFKLNIYDDEGNLSEDFKKSLPEDQKGLIKHFGKYKTTEDALKGLHHMSLRAMKGEVQPLPPNATEAQKTEHAQMVRTALGIPETAGDYQLKLPDGVDKDSIDTGFVDTLKEFAHNNNVTPQAFNDFAPILMQREAAIHQSYQQKESAAIQQGTDALTKEWGADTAANFQAAAKAASLVDADIDPATDPAFMHPTAVKLALAIHKLTANDTRPNASGGSSSAGAGNYREQSLAIVTDPSNQWHSAYHNSKDPQHSAAVSEKQRLSKLAHKAKQV